MGRRLSRAPLREDHSKVEGASAELSIPRRSTTTPSEKRGRSPGPQGSSSTRSRSHQRSLPPVAPAPIKLSAQVAPGSPPTVFVPAMDASLAKAGIVAHGSRVQLTVASAEGLDPGATIQIVLQLPDNTYHQFSGRVDKTGRGQTVLVSDELPLPLLSPIRRSLNAL